MFKRIWIVMLALLAGGVLMSACVGGDLAEDLTPVPTLPPGQEPELRAELQASGDAAAADNGGETTAGSDGVQLDEAQLVALGSDVFASMCASCHPAGADGAGPSFTGMAERAATRVEGVSAEDYLHESIVDPSAHVVDGFADIMPKTFGNDLEDAELQGVVAYIMAESGGAADAAMGDDDVAESETDDTGAGANDEASETDADAESDSDDDDAAAVPTGDAANGETIFAKACGSCHGEEEGVGPMLTGMGERAAERVEGLSAEDYLHESIVDPAAYVVDGFANIMPANFGDTYSAQEIQDIIAYILTQ